MLVVDKETFEGEVLQAQGPVLVDYFGNGCEPCMALLPHIEKFAESYGDRIKFTKLNTSSARRLAISQKIMGLPVIAIYKNGEKIEELIKDDATPDNVEEMIKRHIA